MHGALGGDYLADIAQLRAAAEAFGLMPWDPTVPRLVDALRSRRPGSGSGRWPKRPPPDYDVGSSSLLVIDVDATSSAPTARRSPQHRRSSANSGSTRCGPSPTTAPRGHGMPLALRLRPVNAGPNTVVDAWWTSRVS